MSNFCLETKECKRKKYILEHRKKLINSRRNWTIQEIEFIKKEFPTMKKELLEEHLGTDYKRIYQAAYRLGIKRKV